PPCVRVEKIAFQSGASVDQAIIAVAYADGSNTVTLARGTGPSWSPDGTKIAFAAIDYYCDYYYSDCCYYPVGLAVMSADGSGLVFLTNEASDAQPTWSPDGTRIAFISSRNGRSGVYVLNAGVPTLLTNTPRAVSKPAWSPDGTRLAFTCEVDSGNSDICVINANGTGFTRLTSDPGQDAGPAWKPDGSRIAFATTRYAGAYELASMTPDGGDVTRLSPATAASDPAWQPRECRGWQPEQCAERRGHGPSPRRRQRRGSLRRRGVSARQRHAGRDPGGRLRPGPRARPPSRYPLPLAVRGVRGRSDHPRRYRRLRYRHASGRPAALRRGRRGSLARVCRLRHRLVRPGDRQRRAGGVVSPLLPVRPRAQLRGPAHWTLRRPTLGPRPDGSPSLGRDRSPRHRDADLRP